MYYKSYNNKKSLICSDCNLDPPTNIFHKLPALESVIFSDCNINDIAHNHFENAKYLKSLDLSHNHIEVINSNLFLHTPEIEIIDFSYNQIVHIGKDAFRDRNKLNTIILSYNNITIISPSLFSTNSLATLELNFNSINEIEPNFFNFDTLEKLSVDSNFIADVNNLIKANHTWNLLRFSNNPTKEIHQTDIYSKYLYLSNTNITECTINSFIRILDVSFNKISIVKVSNNTKLMELNLSHNNFSEISNLTTLEYLTELDLSFNPIKNIKLDSFANMNRLIKLNLKNSGLKTIQYGLFSHQENLQFFDISMNQLARLDLNVLVSLNQLREFYINDNNFTELEHLNDIKSILPELRKISLANNPFDCETLATFIKIFNIHQIEFDNGRISSLTKHEINVKGISCQLNDFKNHTEIIKIIEIATVKPIDQNDGKQINFTLASLQVLETELIKLKSSFNANTSIVLENQNIIKTSCIYLMVLLSMLTLSCLYVFRGKCFKFTEKQNYSFLNQIKSTDQSSV